MAVGAGAPRYYRNIALAVLVPGAGLLRSRRRALGIGLVVAWVAVVAFVVVRVAADGGPRRTVLALAVDPVALRWVAAAVGVTVAVWVASIVATAAIDRPPQGRLHTGAAVGVVVVACLVVATPGALAVRYLGVQADLVTDVFAAADGAEPGSAVPGTASPGASSGPTGTTSGAGPSSTPSATEPADPWAGVERVNLVLIGSDAAAGRSGVRTDSMVVASIDAASGDTLLVGIPRNLENVPIPASNPLHRVFPHGYTCGDACLMNGIWTLAEDHAYLFPGVAQPGRVSTVDVLGAVTGLDLSRSVVVDLAGFRELVDAMGGVEVDVTERVCVGCRVTASGTIGWTSQRREWIEPGRQRLDGYHALWYARSRATSDDFSRMRRQRCVVGAILEQADPVRLFARYPAIAKALRHNVSVDIPRDELPAWVDLVERIQSGGSIRSLPLTDEVIDPGRPDYARIRALVRAALEPPAAASPTSTPGPTASGAGEVASPAPTHTPTKAPAEQADPGTALDLSATC